MKIVLINPPHTAIGSRVPDDHLPPLGLLARVFMEREGRGDRRVDDMTARPIEAQLARALEQPPAV